MNTSLSKNSEDEIDKKLLEFYEKLSSEDLEEKAESITPINSASHSKSTFQVDNLRDLKRHKTIEKLSQKDRDKKKLRKKQRKLNTAKREFEKLPSDDVLDSEKLSNAYECKELANECPIALTIEEINQKDRDKKKMLRKKQRKLNTAKRESEKLPSGNVFNSEKLFSALECKELANECPIPLNIEEINQKDRDKKKMLRKKKRKLNTAKRECEKLPWGDVLDSEKLSIAYECNELANECPIPSISKSKNVEEEENMEFDTPNSKSLFCKPDGNGNLLVALFPNTKTFIVGNYKLKLILGNISVLGYLFKENEEHVVYSPPTHGILSVDAHDGHQVKMFDKQRIMDLALPYEWIHDLNISKETSIVIVKLSRFESNMTEITKLLEERGKKNAFDVCIWKETLGVELIEDPQSCKFCLQEESEEWTPFMDQVQSYLTSHTRSKNIFVICGGKSVGKSTFLKYLTNKFLSSFGCSAVACIDLDPGQPEFSLPSCLTLSVYKTPLLGPSFSHRESMKFIYQKQILLGHISVPECYRDYLNIASYLFSHFKRHYSSVPLIVNTMGFTAMCGFDIMVDILRMSEPSHVISIRSSSDNNNYPYPLSSNIISSTNRGSSRNERKRLDYVFTEFKTVAKDNRNEKAKLSRDRNIVAYLSKLWKANEPHFSRYTVNPPLTLKWSTVAIHLFKPAVNSTVLNAINSSLVALCGLDEEFLYRVDASQPLRLHYNSPWYIHCQCLGWGVVCGIDHIAREIQIYTPLDKERIREVNLIALPNVSLPQNMEKFLLSGNSCYSTKKNQNRRK